MKVLFIGAKFGNSYRQYLAIKKNYKKVDLIDGKKVLFLPWITNKIFFRISPLIFQSSINHHILSKVTKNYDLIYVKSGEIIGKQFNFRIKKKNEKDCFFL